MIFDLLLGYIVGGECTAFLMYAVHVTWPEIDREIGPGFILIPILWPIAVPLATLVFGAAAILDLASKLKTIKAPQGPGLTAEPNSWAIVPYQVYKNSNGHRIYYDEDGHRHYG